MGLPGGSVGKESAGNEGDAGDAVSIRGLGRSPGEGNGISLQYSCLGIPMDRGARWARVDGITESDTSEVTEHTSTHTKMYNNKKGLNISLNDNKQK